MQLPSLPHQLLQQRITSFYDDEVRSVAGPQDPGWFGPGSAVSLHVDPHMPALVFGLQCAAYIERFSNS